MSNHLEIVMDIDTLEIFEVINHDENSDDVEIEELAVDSDSVLMSQEKKVQSNKQSKTTILATERYVQLTLFDTILDNNLIGQKIAYFNDS
ncbi:TPA: hypothetical protein TUL06_001230 [Streptococcus equi subsp. zooepidemicus]|uniref:Uncharacterized protein n=1 Tax=Streptococcus equi subsp. zooepidemicus Sz4is TaxID=1381082 RepID=A0AAW3GP95_STRSZ|nr:hypothetical protein AT55_01045 [Streptococcus equi subsp. zooepidemicus Sz4is]HEL0009497.1 hypothetical protein [Streptococcus equi subsp. zooepidemicus]HEL0011571.1 hypothetical protein [Streptococcus equi subsp. zooepidemicus]HEL0014094.1 hypothetical protein [Streptococcus equi subsp. zooepidemicus]HEL0018128.1 hypothetical protein [Streptococcus equi subsp. zooepidemicus]